MNPKILTESCKFMCDKNPSLLITAKNYLNLKAKISKKSILTKNAVCNVNVSLTCPILTANAGGTPTLCALSSKVPLNWKNTASKVKISKNAVLTSDSNAFCPFSMGKAKIKPVLPMGIVTLKFSMPDTDISSANNQSVSNNQSISNTRNNNANNLSHKKEITAPISENNTLTNGKLKTSEILDSKTSEQTSKKDDEIVFAPNCRCDYQECTERSTCEYFNTQVYIENNSAKLSSNFKKYRSCEWERYLSEHNEKNAVSTEGNWRIAAHHIISGNQVLLMKDSAGHLLYGDIVKLANYFGYDVNNALNCIMLPTNESNFGEKEPIAKIANAYEVMHLMGRQWHVGSHEYKLSADTLEKLRDYYRKNPEFYSSVGTPEFFSNYKTAMKEEMDKIQAKIRDQCWKKDFNRKQKKFISYLDSLSKKVEEKLLAFVDDPRRSFPFFVSVVSVEYAFKIPSTAKLIVFYKDKSVLTAKKFRIERYRKNNLDIIINEKESIKADSPELVKFCENVMYFIIDSNIGYKIPFVADETDDFSVKNMDIGNTYVNSFMQEHISEIIAFIQQNPKSYKPIAKIIRNRLPYKQ